MGRALVSHRLHGTQRSAPRVWSRWHYWSVYAAVTALRSTVVTPRVAGGSSDHERRHGAQAGVSTWPAACLDR